MKFESLAQLIFNNMVPKLEGNNGLFIFAKERAKFEGWLKVELCESLSKYFSTIIPEKDRIDVVFDNSVTPGIYYFDFNRDGNRQSGEYQRRLSDFKGGIDFAGPASGCIANTTGWNNNPLTNSTTITWNSNGTAASSPTATGAVFLQDTTQSKCYAVSVNISGLVKLRRFEGGGWN